MPKTSTERVREFRARERLWKLQPEQEKLGRSLVKTPAEILQEFRARERLAKQLHEVQEKQRTKKTSAQRVREFRARRRLLKQLQEGQEKLERPVAKTSTERTRAYRQRLKEKRKLLDHIKNNLSCDESSLLCGTENQVKVEDYKISIKTEDDSDYDYNIEIKEEKWDIQSSIKEESTASFLSNSENFDDYSGQLKAEVKDEPSPTTSDMDLEMTCQEDITDDTIKTEHSVENIQSPPPPTSSLQANPPLPDLTISQLPANSVLLLIPSIQGPQTLIHLNMLSPNNVSNIILPNTLPLLNFQPKPPDGNNSFPQ